MDDYAEATCPQTAIAGDLGNATDHQATNPRG